MVQFKKVVNVNTSFIYMKQRKAPNAREFYISNTDKVSFECKYNLKKNSIFYMMIMRQYMTFKTLSMFNKMNMKKL